VCDMLKCIVLIGLEIFQAIFFCAYMRNNQTCGERRGRGSSATEVSSTKMFVKKQIRFFSL